MTSLTRQAGAPVDTEPGAAHGRDEGMQSTRRLRLGVVVAATLSLPVTVLSSSPALATPSPDVPAVTLVSDSADINTSQVADDSQQSSSDKADNSFLTFTGQQPPVQLTTRSTSASAGASQSAALTGPATPTFPQTPLDDISLDGAASSAVSAAGGSAVVPIATSNGSLSVRFTTSGSVPVFLTGSEHTTNTDSNDSCSLASVVLTGPVSRSFVATAGACKVVEPNHQKWAQSITLPAGSYRLDVAYATKLDDNIATNEATSLNALTTLSVNMSFFPPTAKFTTSLSGSTATFDAAAAVAGAGGRPVTAWQWRFGDGTTAVTGQPRIAHDFPAGPLHAPTYRVTLQVVDSAHAVSPPVARDVLGTASTLVVDRTPSRLNVSGVVTPDRQGRAESVTLARKVGSTLQVIASHRPLLSSNSRYSTSFRRPSPGTCVVTARYAGDRTHLAGTARRSITC